MTFGDTVDLDTARTHGRHRARRRHHLHRHRQRVCRRAQRGDARPRSSSAGATPRRSRPRPASTRVTPGGAAAALGRGTALVARGEPAPAAHRPRRRLLPAPARPVGADRRDRLCPGRVRQGGQDPRDRRLQLLGLADRRRLRGVRRARHAAAGPRAAALQPRRPPHRGGVPRVRRRRRASRPSSTTRSAAACSPDATPSRSRPAEGRFGSSALADHVQGPLLERRDVRGHRGPRRHRVGGRHHPPRAVAALAAEQAGRLVGAARADPNHTSWRPTSLLHKPVRSPTTSSPRATRQAWRSPGRCRGTTDEHGDGAQPRARARLRPPGPRPRDDPRLLGHHRLARRRPSASPGSATTTSASTPSTGCSTTRASSPA